MKTIKIFLALISFTGLTLNASSNMNNSAIGYEWEYAHNAGEDEKINTQDWVISPIINKYVTGDEDITDEESISLIFPVQPEYTESEMIDCTDESKSFRRIYTAEDSDGMKYSVSSLQKTAFYTFDNKCRSFERLVGSVIIAQSQSGKIIRKGKLQFNESDGSSWTGYTYSVVKAGNECDNVMLVEGEHFIYLLSTTVEDEIYQHLDGMEVGDPVFEKQNYDLNKNAVFQNSFRFLQDRAAKY